MLYDSTVTDGCFASGRPPDRMEELFDWLCQQLGREVTRSWRLISARRKLGRTLFEIEERTRSGTRRLIGKCGNPERAWVLYETLNTLRDHGWRPPARYTVPEPVALIPERGLIIQERVWGEQAGSLLLKDGKESRLGAASAASWLAALHHCGLSAPLAPPDTDAVSKWATDLVFAVPAEARRIELIADAVLDELQEPIAGTAPTHGDFHPMNVFIAGRERVTGIKFDKFARREPEADIGWFLMQAAAFGFFERGSFSATETARRTFVQRYGTEAGRRLADRRLALYVAMAFLKNLHFELVLLRTGRTHYADPWLWGAASAILEENLELAA